MLEFFWVSFVRVVHLSFPVNLFINFDITINEVSVNDSKNIDSKKSF